ncbi:glycosyl transferase [Maribacter sp.]|uniref:glycosyl transferase n=1 Tax=Maribacter sp. TaxID=1897614 RepID=UPI0025BF9254|nr:glycosyl transferase [Maribacter sp.]
MKVIKELPLSILHSLKYTVLPTNFFTKKSKPTAPVIVSLTSIPQRFGTLHLVIKSILNQDILPKKVILWLNEEHKGIIPNNVKKLESSIFEIRFTKLHCSHKKLIHTLTDFPDTPIITCDDDLMYRKNWLNMIYKEHQKNPNYIIGIKTSHINFENGNSLPFKKWRDEFKTSINQKAFVPIGAWGILYPAKSLHKEVFNIDKMMALAPKADDLWFKAMAILNNTISIQATKTPKEPIPIIGTQKVALKKDNLQKDKNTVQWQAIDKEYGINKIILSQ